MTQQVRIAHHILLTIPLASDSAFDVLLSWPPPTMTVPSDEEGVFFFASPVAVDVKRSQQTDRILSFSESNALGFRSVRYDETTDDASDAISAEGITSSSMGGELAMGNGGGGIANDGHDDNISCGARGMKLLLPS